MKKALFIIAIVILITILALFLTKDILIKAGIENGARIVTGLKLHIGGFKAGLLDTIINIDDLKLYNPKGFEDKVMIDMPNIYVDYNLPSIFKGTMHFYTVKLNLREFVVVKDKNGKLNLDSLKVVQADKQEKKPQDIGKDKAPQVQIDVLELRIDRVVYKDYTAGEKPSIREFNVNINEKFTNIKDAYSLVSIIVVKALMNTTIANLVNIDLGGLSDTIKGTLLKATKLTSGTAAAATKVLGETSKALTDAAGSITKKLSLPFGTKQE